MNTVSEKSHLTEHKQGGLGVLAATAICGNDITSSCLYVSALALLTSGRWAPVALLLVVGLLYLFRSIYGEVVGALPLNGGAYNALLNTTSKYRASLAACLTILSYMATAVLSANEAIHYLQGLWPVHWNYTWIMGATISLLGLFMILTIVGISESAVVAIGIFTLHMASLTLLVLVGLIYVATTGIATFTANLHTPTEIGILPSLFFGFSAALLGISGFESSANFVEEQAEGVFPKTLRNMWLAVGIFNPLIALLALAIIPLGDLNDANKTALLADLGTVVGHGAWLGWIISVDAVLVLSGAVLTSYVGVTGLINRMSLDRCLPQFLLQTNRRGTPHFIIVLFFLLSVSVLLITQGNLESLAGVYTLSFLSVMALFCLGNILLKVKRSRLPRPVRAPWPYVITALLAVVLGIVGNTITQRPANLFHVTSSGKVEHDATFVLTGPRGKTQLKIEQGCSLAELVQQVNATTADTGIVAQATSSTLAFATHKVGSEAKIQLHVLQGEFEMAGGHGTHAQAQGADGLSNLQVFLHYFIPALLIVTVMLSRIALLKASVFIIRGTIGALLKPMHSTVLWMHKIIDDINSQQMVFFTRGDDIANLNNAMLYVKNNEHTNRIKIVTVVKDSSEVPPRLEQELKFLDEAYPSIDIEFVVIEDMFGPKLIDKLSHQWGIPKNFMFIGSPGDHFLYGLAELGGVRLII